MDSLWREHDAAADDNSTCGQRTPCSSRTPPLPSPSATTIDSTLSRRRRGGRGGSNTGGGAAALTLEVATTAIATAFAPFYTRLTLLKLQVAANQQALATAQRAHRVPRAHRAQQAQALADEYAEAEALEMATAEAEAQVLAGTRALFSSIPPAPAPIYFPLPMPRASCPTTSSLAASSTSSLATLRSTRPLVPMAA